MWNVHEGTCEWNLDHKNVAVLCCDFSPDGTKLLTGDVEGSVKVEFIASLQPTLLTVFSDLVTD